MNYQIVVSQKLVNNSDSICDVQILPWNDEFMVDEENSSSWNDMHTSKSARLSRDEIIERLVDLHVPSQELAEEMVSLADEEDGYSFKCQQEWGVQIPRVAYDLQHECEHIFETEEEYKRLLAVYYNKKWTKLVDEFRPVFKLKTYEDKIYREMNEVFAPRHG